MHVSNRPKVLMVAALLTAAIGACSDRTPTTPGARFAPTGTPSSSKGPSTGADLARGTARFTVRRLDSGALPGTADRTEEGNYVVVGNSKGEADASVSVGGTTFSVTFQVGSSAVARGGNREFRFHGVAGAREHIIRFSSEGGAPVSESEIVRDGVPVARMATTWRRVPGGWQLQEQVVTLLQNGRPVVSTTLTLSEPSGPVASASLATAREAAPRDAARFDEDPGVCQKEVDAMEDALVTYEAAAAAMFLCFGGPIACAAAGMASMVAGVRLEMSESRVERCLAEAR